MLRIATWNINSVRLRVQHVIQFLQQHKPDILCLQELKAATDKFPSQIFTDAGYSYQAVEGQAGYNGVAFISKIPINFGEAWKLCHKDDARHLSITCEIASHRPLTLHGFYVPAGGDEPNPQTNPKFAHKLDFIDEISSRLHNVTSSILLGDLNIAPLENDVWSHKQMRNIVSHTEIEIEKLTKAQKAGGWIDSARALTPAEEKLFTWWSYRAKDWQASNRGRRLDHIWISSDLGSALKSAITICEPRSWEKPSDHVPVMIELDI